MRLTVTLQHSPISPLQNSSRQGALIRAAEHMDQAETDAKVALGTAGRPQCEGDRDGDGIRHIGRLSR